MSDHKYSDSESFFKHVGFMYLYAMGSESGSAISVEEMYQHFYSRITKEMGLNCDIPTVQPV